MLSAVRSSFRASFLVIALAVVIFVQPQAFAQFSGTADASSAQSIPTAQTVQPADLAKLLAGPAEGRPAVFQVGSKLFFAQKHIAGSVFAGPGSLPAGLDLLTAKVAKLKKTQAIVLYCGCCPWVRCPNVGPAYKKLRDQGFTNVKVLYLVNNFGDDWVAKGLPVESGE